jgi:ATP-dependent protease ClpP protease subunit
MGKLVLQDMIMQRFIKFYSEKTKVEKDKIKDMLARDFWMDSKTSLRLAFADEILK